MAFQEFMNFQETLEYISNHQDSLALKASIAKDVLLISDKNEIVLSILQEATCNVADYIINLNEMPFNMIQNIVTMKKKNQ